MHRKAAITAFKARVVRRGVFAVRCRATGHAWIDSAPNLEAARNRVWFCLRNRDVRNPMLQAEWDAHGQAAFEFEVLETLSEDESPIIAGDLLKARKRDWMARLQAPTF
jgi:hypothetical protein